MAHLTRREWAIALTGALVALPVRRLWSQSRSTVNGVRIGVQTYVFRDRPLDEVPATLRQIGLSFAELWSGHVETAQAIGASSDTPRDARRELLRAWRLKVPLSHFSAVRQAFSAAGVTITSYDVPYRDDWTDDEMARSFEMARALGVTVVTSSASQSVVPRAARQAERAGMTLAVHNHSAIRPDEFATPADFVKAMQVSPAVGVTLDIGHFTAANFDAVAFLDEHHARVRALHIKDRKRDQGPGTPFGEGDAPIRAVLQRLRDRKWDIPAHIEFDRSSDPVADVTTFYEYCRKALEV